MDCIGPLSQTDGRALLDVTISGTCPGWFDPDGYQFACLFGRVGSQSQALLKRHLVRDHVIGGKNEHRCCVIASHDPTRAERDRGSGVAFRRFSYDVFFWKTPEQFANGAFLFGVGQDQNAFIRNKTFKTRQRFFEQSLI